MQHLLRGGGAGDMEGRLDQVRSCGEEIIFYFFILFFVVFFLFFFLFFILFSILQYNPPYLLLKDQTQYNQVEKRLVLTFLSSVDRQLKFASGHAAKAPQHFWPHREGV